MSSLDRYVVIGNPIAHSKSPLIHRLFAEQTGQSMAYSTLLVEEGQLKSQLERFRRDGGKGANITVPFKEQAWQLMDTCSERAHVARAVNTIAIRDNSYFGDNTDGLGLMCDLQTNHRLHLQGARILVLGAGGAARGVVQPLLEVQPSWLGVVNRTAARAEELRDYYVNRGYELWAGGYQQLPAQACDVIINASAASLHGAIPELPNDLVSPRTTCYDMMYSQADTPFMTWARNRGAGAVYDGLGMLVEQAAESFRIWRGIRPHTSDVIRQVRAALAN